jgi:putative ABC transport system permease protein
MPIFPWTRRVPLAWRILVHDRRRLAWSIAGVAFGVLLMFVEIGFMHAAYDSTTVLIDALDADLIVINRMKEDMFPLEPFPRARLYQTKAVAEVEGAYPLYLSLYAGWRNERDGLIHPLRVVGFEPADPIWLRPDLRDQAAALTRAETCLFDSESRDHYGDVAVGARGELNGHNIEIVGTVRLGPDLVLDGTLWTGIDTYFRFLPDPATGEPGPSQVEFGVLHLVPGADVERARAAVRAALPDDVEVLTKPAMIRRVHDYWRANQPVGQVFATGMAVGFAIGVMICYQILFTEISDALPQYATLKAIGYRDRFLVATVFRQAIYLALGAFVVGGAAALATYQVLERVTGLRMWLAPDRVLLVGVLTVAMCAVSAALAVRKATRSDPAEVF